MATKRLGMRKSRQILRQKWELKLSRRQVARSLELSAGTVSGTVQRAAGKPQARGDLPETQVLLGVSRSSVRANGATTLLRAASQPAGQCAQGFFEGREIRLGHAIAMIRSIELELLEDAAMIAYQLPAERAREIGRHRAGALVAQPLQCPDGERVHRIPRLPGGRLLQAEQGPPPGGRIVAGRTPVGGRLE